MLYSVIDIGSNTVKLSVLDEDNLFTQAPVFFKAVPLNLRSKVVEGSLPPNVVRELALLVREFSLIAHRLTPAEPLAFATASLRGLKNAREVLEEVFRESGVRVHLISGEEEALFSFLGARGGSKEKTGISVDLGGGSTEILAFSEKGVLDSVSLPFGCLTLYHGYFEGIRREYNACGEMIRKQLSQYAPKMTGNTILLSGGSAKAVLKYKNLLEGKRNLSLEVGQMKKIRLHFDFGEKSEREKIENALKDRFRLIPAALTVFTEIASFYGKNKMLVSRFGVREGALFHHLQKN